jgi:hypothetical protein
MSTNPYAAPTAPVQDAAIQSPLPGLTPKEVRRLYHHSRNIGGFAVVLGFGALIIGFLLVGLQRWNIDISYLLILLALLAAHVVGIVGLVTRANWGRVVGGLLAIFSLLNVQNRWNRVSRISPPTITLPLSSSILGGDAGGWVHNTTCAIEKAARNEVRPTCFAEGTWVLTPDGGQQINRLNVGDLVLSRCEHTGEQGFRRVTKYFRHEVEEEENQHSTLRITYVNPDRKANLEKMSWPQKTSWGPEDAIDMPGYLEVTPEHPIWVVGKGWVPAGELEVGQLLEIMDPRGNGQGHDGRGTRPDGTSAEDYYLSGVRFNAEIVSIEPGYPEFCVYNIEVEEYHTYFASFGGVWVHNKNQMTPVFSQNPTRVTPDAKARGERFLPKPELGCGHTRTNFSR